MLNFIKNLSMKTKLEGAEKFNTIIKIDKDLDRKPNETSFPKKLEEAKLILSNLKIQLLKIC